MSFHFSPNQPEQQIFSDVQALNSFNDTQFVQFIEIVLSLFTSQSSGDTMDRIATFAGENGINVNGLKGIMRSLLVVCRGALKANLNPGYFKEDLISLGLYIFISYLFKKRKLVTKTKLFLRFIGREEPTICATLEVQLYSYDQRSYWEYTSSKPSR